MGAALAAIGALDAPTGTKTLLSLSISSRNPRMYLTSTGYLSRPSMVVVRSMPPIADSIISCTWLTPSP